MEPRAMYTGGFVHSGWPGRSCRRNRIEGPDLNESVRGTSVVEELRVEGARVRNSWGPSHRPPLGAAGTSRTRGEVQERPGNQGDLRAVLEDAARSGEGQAS